MGDVIELNKDKKTIKQSRDYYLVVDGDGNEIRLPVSHFYALGKDGCQLCPEEITYDYDNNFDGTFCVRKKVGEEENGEAEGADIEVFHVEGPSEHGPEEIVTFNPCTGGLDRGWVEVTESVDRDDYANGDKDCFAVFHRKAGE